MSEKQRDSALDIVKGLCILLVVYGHLQRTGSLEPCLTKVVQFIYTFHMPIFIFISGFLFGNRTGCREDVKRVVTRILKPYFIVGIVLAFVYWILDRLSPGSFSPVQKPLLASVCDLLRGSAGGALWFLYDLALTQLVSIAWFSVSDRWKRWWARDVGLLVVLLAVATVLNDVNCRIGFRGIYLAVWFAVYFALGVCARRWFVSLPAFGWACVPMVALAVFLPIDRESFWNYPYVLSMIAFLLWVARRIDATRIGKGLAYLGERSMALLLFHPFFLGAMKPVARLAAKVDSTGLLGMVISLLVAVLGCLLVDRIILKTRLKSLVY